MLCNIISYYGANKGGIQDSKCPMQNRSRAKRGNKWKVKSRKANKAGGCKQTGQHALSERERLESFFSFLFLWRALVDAGSSFDEEPGRQNIEAGRQEWLWGYCPLSEASFFFMIVGFKRTVSVKRQFILNSCHNLTSKTASTWTAENLDWHPCHRCLNWWHLDLWIILYMIFFS